jgi:hypothetical protein
MSKTVQAGRPFGRLESHYTPVRSDGGLVVVRGGCSGTVRAPFGAGRGVFIGGEKTLLAAPHPLLLSSFRAKRSGDPEPSGAR